jgi:emfourin
MKISITQGGSIVPVVTTTEVDSDSLGPDDAAALQKLVDKAGIGGGRASDSGPPQPDRGGYRITIDDRGKQESLAMPEADLSDETRALVDFVSEHPKATRRTEPLGS